MKDKHVLVVGAGFAGLNTAKSLGNKKGVQVTVLDRRNHHLFQPLLYQVAMAGLSPADIAAPIRSVLAGYDNIQVFQETVVDVDTAHKKVVTDFREHVYDYLVLACGAQHSYFGREEWEPFAPGLKTIQQATEIRRRVLSAFEAAERGADPAERKKYLSFVIVGGGPTGVELAGAIGEMSRYTLAKDFKHIDPKLTRIMLVEAGPRILAAFDPKLSSRAVRDLEKLGVQVWTDSMVTQIDDGGVSVGEERIEAATVLWAAGVQAGEVGEHFEADYDRQGRVMVQPDLSLEKQPQTFVIGDQAHAKDVSGNPLPGLCPVAIQQGKYIGQLILAEINGKPRKPFTYYDKGIMATIGRNRAIVQSGWMQGGGFLAWCAWLFVHIYYLIGFRNRLFVFMNWVWSYLSFKKGARLILSRDWRMVKELDT